MNGINEMTNFEKMVTSCYFIITTLSTCGFGDFFPNNNFEKIIGIVLMIIGVAFFSNFVGTFITVADSLSDNSQQKNQTDLNNWITILKYFTQGKSLPKEFIDKLEKNFEYFWAED